MRKTLHKTEWPAFAVTLALLLALPASAQLPPPPPPPPVPSLPAPVLPGPPAPGPAAAEAPPPAAAPAERVIPEGLTPANRDPFWPIGFVPKTTEQLESERTRNLPAAGPVAQAHWSEARESLRIGGYMKGPRGLTALVNNTLVGPGEIVAHVFEGFLYRWKVESISARGITFSPLDWKPAEGPVAPAGKDRP